MYTFGRALRTITTVIRLEKVLSVRFLLLKFNFVYVHTLIRDIH